MKNKKDTTKFIVKTAERVKKELETLQDNDSPGSNNPKQTKEKKQRVLLQSLQKRTYIQSLNAGNTRKQASEDADAGVTTIWEWKRDDKQFEADIQSALESRIQVVEDALFKSATEGKEKRNVIAQIFWLKNRGKNWRDKQDIEFIAPKTVKQNTFVQAGKEPTIEEDPDPIIKVEDSEDTLLPNNSPSVTGHHQDDPKTLTG